MPESSAPALSLEQATRGGGLMRRLVLRELAPLDQGRLRLFLPEGGHVAFGNPAAEGPGAMIQVKDENTFRRIVMSADIGLTEGYIEGEWDSPDLAAVIGFFLENIARTPNVSGSGRKALALGALRICLLYTSPSPRDRQKSRMPSSA